MRQVDKKQIKRLYSFDFYDFFENKTLESRYWKLVDIKEPLLSGDVIACTNEARKGRFGHVAVVENELSRTKDIIRLRVIDSSEMTHEDEYRQSDKMGIGSGILELHLEQGKVTQICYMPECAHVRSVLIGRLK